MSFRTSRSKILLDLQMGNKEEIIKRLSPVHSGDNIAKTAKSNTFKLFLTGHDDAALVRQKKLAVAKAELQGQQALLKKRW